jgi:biopolymer transport protein TolR
MRSQRRRKALSEMNVVPYIDVMLVLLVIFMVTAPMMQAGVMVNLPDVNAKPLESNNQQEPLIIAIDVDGNYLLDDGSEVQLIALSKYIAGYLGSTPNKPIYLRADENVANGFVVKAMIAIQTAGAENIGMMANIASSIDQSL